MNRGIVLLFLEPSTLDGGGVSPTHRPPLPPGKTRYPLYEAGWAPGPVWTGAENLAPTGIGSPDRPSRSQWLYRLRYPAYRVPLLQGENVFFRFHEDLHGVSRI